MDGRVGRLFNHDQLLLGMCGRRKSTDAICRSASTILNSTSSIPKNLGAAAAHAWTTLASFGMQYQGTCGDIVTITPALAVLNRVVMHGVIGCHRGVFGPKTRKTARSASIIPPFPSRSCRTAYGKSAVIALRLHSIVSLFPNLAISTSALVIKSEVSSSRVLIPRQNTESLSSVGIPLILNHGIQRYTTTEVDCDDRQAVDDDWRRGRGILSQAIKRKAEAPTGHFRKPS